MSFPHGADTRGAYFGGLANVTNIDPYDVPSHDPDFDRIASAADREMIAVLSMDRETRLTKAAVREFVMITDEVAA